MARPIGLPKSGGRQKGTPNRRTKILKELLDSIEFSVPEQIIQLLPDLPPEKQIDVLLKMMGFVYPKVSPRSFQSVDVTDLINIDT